MLDLGKYGVGIRGIIDAEHKSTVWELDNFSVVGVVDGSDNVAIPRHFLDDSGVKEAGIATARGEKYQGKAWFPSRDGSIGLAEGVQAFEGAIWKAVLCKKGIVDYGGRIWHVSRRRHGRTMCRWLGVKMLRVVSISGVVKGEHNLSVFGAIGEWIKSCLSTSGKVLTPTLDALLRVGR